MKKWRPGWGTGIAAVYAVFAMSTLAFVAFAIAQPVDLVSADYYSQALSFDGRQAATSRATALGSGVSVSVQGRDLVIRIEGQRGASGSATLYRPSRAGADHVVAIALDANDTQRIDGATLAAGRWIVKLAWQYDGRAYYREQAVDLR